MRVVVEDAGGVTVVGCPLVRLVYDRYQKVVAHRGEFEGPRIPATNTPRLTSTIPDIEIGILVPEMHGYDQGLPVDGKLQFPLNNGLLSLFLLCHFPRTEWSFRVTLCGRLFAVHRVGFYVAIEDDSPDRPGAEFIDMNLAFHGEGNILVIPRHNHADRRERATLCIDCQ